MPMSGRRYFHLMTSALTACSLMLSPLQASFAQSYAPGPAIAPQPQAGDPPARVGRLGFVQGTVSFHTADEDHWESASLNYPVSDGNAFWADSGALARIGIDASAIWLNGVTELDVNHLDLHTLQATEPQGEIYLHLRALAQGDVFVVQTPRGAVSMGVNGRYEIAAGDTDHPTTVTVLEGAAQVTGPNLSLQVQANQTATINGAQSFQGSIGPATPDAFLTAMLQRERPATNLSTNVTAGGPAIVSQMTGCEDLPEYGAWQPAPEYGQVWYPHVDPGWVPYREGHWAYVAPWGWTWVDNAPWGFAPFHYGRWVQVDNRWGWVPESAGQSGGYGPPVYAPALVTFFGLGAAAAIGIGAAAAFSHGTIGWVPLGPREAYYPPYRASDGYLQRINRPNVTNVTQITSIRQTYNTMTINNFANRAGATAVPAEAMTSSRPVAAQHEAVSPASFANLHPIGGRPVVAPVATTAGVTPTVARQFALPAAPARPAAPGPAVNQGVFRNVPGRPGAAPPLHGTAVAPAVAEPGQPGIVRPGPEQARPERARPEQAAPGLPALRPPGAEPGVPRPNAGAPGPEIVAHPQGEQRPATIEPAAPVTAPRSAELPRVAEPVPPVAPLAPRPPVPAERPQPQAEAPHPAFAAPPPHPEPSRPEPPRPEPQHIEAPRPAPARVEAPRVEAPRVEAPRAEPPRPAPPRPEPPHAEPPHPAPAARPAPHPEKPDQKQ